MNKSCIFAIDFDGTIVENKYPQIGQLIPEAAQAMRKINELGHRIIIWTCRRGEHLQAALDCLRGNQVPFDYVNENVPENIEAFGGDCRKLFADVYVDDRNVGQWSWTDVMALANLHKPELGVPTARDPK